MGIERSENNSNRVFDLNAARKVKETVGRGAAIPLNTSPESLEFAKHTDEAIKVANTGTYVRKNAEPTKREMRTKKLKDIWDTLSFNNIEPD